MKITYTIACLLGLAAADEPVWKLSSVLGHKDDQEVQNGYGSYSTEAANARPPYKSTVQILSESDKVIEKLDDGSKIGGEPTGVFMMGKKDMTYAAKEVLGTHKGLSGGSLSDYLDTYFDKAWENFDVNGDGAIEVIKSPMFMRFLCSDQGMQLGESG